MDPSVQAEQSLVNLPVNQLLERQKSYESELSQFNTAFQQLKYARERFASSNSLLNVIKEDQKGFFHI